MKNLIGLVFFSLCITTTCSAANTKSPSNPFTPPGNSGNVAPANINTATTNWISPNSYSSYYIRTGARMTITIRVNNGSAGVSLTNCGPISGVAAGSATVCNVMNTSAPVSITSTSQSAVAQGTYQIKLR